MDKNSKISHIGLISKNELSIELYDKLVMAVIVS
jgi:hypothetical protein